jgi:TolB protein
MPVAMTADAVLGEADLLEVACLWTDEIGTAAFWHSILNLGIPLAVSAGSDAMVDYYRTMAVGSTRVYVKPEGAFTEASYLKALREGKSFVSNGPQLEFSAGDTGPGEVLPAGTKKVRWTLEVHSPVAYEKVELFVNGVAVASYKGSDEPGNKSYKGTLKLPENGWVTARISGGKGGWPMMDTYPFAESSPVWIGAVGSTDADAKKAAAKDLLYSLDYSEARLKRGYGETPIPKLMEQFGKARERLNAIIESDGQ